MRLLKNADGEYVMDPPGANVEPRLFGAPAVVTALDRVLIAKGEVPLNSIPEAVLNPVRTGKVVRLSEWMSEALSALSSPDKSPDTPRRTFDRAKNRLQAIKIVGVWEDWAWRNF